MVDSGTDQHVRQVLIYLATFGVKHRVLDKVVMRLFNASRVTAEEICVALWALALLGYGDAKFWRGLHGLSNRRFGDKKRRLVDSSLSHELLAQLGHA